MRRDNRQFHCEHFRISHAVSTYYRNYPALCPSLPFRDIAALEKTPLLGPAGGRFYSSFTSLRLLRHKQDPIQFNLTSMSSSRSKRPVDHVSSPPVNDHDDGHDDKRPKRPLAPKVSSYTASPAVPSPLNQAPHPLPTAIEYGGTTTRPSPLGLGSSANTPYVPITVTVYRGETEYKGADAINLVEDLAEAVNSHLIDIIGAHYGSKFVSRLHTFYTHECRYRAVSRTSEEVDCILGLVNGVLTGRKSIVDDIVRRVEEHGGTEDTRRMLKMFTYITSERKKCYSFRSLYKNEYLEGTLIEPLPTLRDGKRNVITQDSLDEEFYHLCICAEGTLKHLKERVSNALLQIGKRCVLKSDKDKLQRLVERFGMKFREYKEALSPSGILARAYKHDLDGQDMPRISSDLQTLLEPSLEDFKSKYDYKNSIPW
jgi:hypothetical protein